MFRPPMFTTMYFVPTGCEFKSRAPFSDLAKRQKTEAASDSVAISRLALFIPA